MLLTPHTLIGIAVASAVQDPLVAVPVAFLLHFVFDLVPHWDFYTGVPRQNRKDGWRPLAVMADMGIGIGIGTVFVCFTLWKLQNPYLALTMLLCGIASVLPDVLTGPSLYVENSPKLFKLMHRIQSKLQTQANVIFGNLTQVVSILASLLVIKHSLGL